MYEISTTKKMLKGNMIDPLKNPQNYFCSKLDAQKKSAGVCYFYLTLKSKINQMSSFEENARK